MNPRDIFDIKSQEDFLETSIRVFRFQYKHNKIYRDFCEHLKVNEKLITSLHEIPFLPIDFFKNKKIISTPSVPEHVFTSSGTTGQLVSKHYVHDLNLYEQSFIEAFRFYYGAIENYIILALLPSYMERSGSSLVYMAQHLIEQSNHSESGFFLHDLEALSKLLKKLNSSGQKVLLIGVSFALLDLVDMYTFKLRNTIVMETGGMKGRRKELIRQELHQILKKGFGVHKIHSEYGMTELLSQSYSKGEGVFKTPPWMKVMIRDSEDPFTYIGNKKTGGINIIDLANLYSCSFISTHDLGKTHIDNSFEVLGRFDHADIRGCNLMVL